MSENKTSTQPFLEVKDLTVYYTVSKVDTKAVNGVSFSLNRGETLGLVGETGAGKTTIAKSILRILPQPPARVISGEINFEGKTLTSLPESEMLKIRGDKISMIFQDPMTALNPVLRIGDQISEVIALHNNVSKAEAKKRAGEMLEMVGIPASRYSEYPHQFSGGMKQRVVIAMALACSPDLLLADEPTTALDVTIQAQVLDMINDLKRKNNTAMILITHDLGVVAETCDKVAVVYAGEIIESGSKEDIFDHPTHPYTIGLFGAIPNLEDDEEYLHPIDGLPPDPTKLPDGCAFSPRCPHVCDACRKGKMPNRELTPGHFCRCIMNAEKEN
ncbi:MAG: ABC transporter ATP-binding protein [Anaerolineaceae bacterium]|nr:ABC transporter ATP-binding protein [Anaerolineaceae bacterium]